MDLNSNFCIVKTKEKYYLINTVDDTVTHTFSKVSNIMFKSGFLIITYRSKVEVYRVKDKSVEQKLMTESQNPRTNYDAKFDYPSLEITDLSDGNCRKYTYSGNMFTLNPVYLSI